MNRIASVAAAALAGLALGARAEVMDDAVPAMIVLHAEAAEVATGADGQTVTLLDVFPLAAVTAELGEKRQFHSFHVSDFAEGWNSCNDLKDEEALWHEDGTNALLEFASGPDSGDGYRRFSPLYTAAGRDDATMVTDEAAGSVRLMLDDAAYDAAAASQTFAVRGGAIADGRYEDVVLLAECLAG